MGRVIRPTDCTCEYAAVGRDAGEQVSPRHFARPYLSHHMMSFFLLLMLNILPPLLTAGPIVDVANSMGDRTGAAPSPWFLFAGCLGAPAIVLAAAWMFGMCAL